MQSNSDLVSLRSDPRWQKTIERAETKLREQQNEFWNKNEF
jgi:hypothetical protein